MTQEEQGRLTVAIERVFRDRIKETLDNCGATDAEQLAIAAAVVALMLKKLYQQLGTTWLETILRMVLTPD